MRWVDTLFDRCIRPLRARGKFRFLSRLLPRAGTRRARVWGCEMSLDLADLVQRGVYLGSYEFNETRLVRRLLRPGDTAIDIGANCGYYTALFAQLVGPRGRVLALEPNPFFAAKLRELVTRNQLTQVTVIEAGASDSEQTRPLSIPPKSTGNETATLAAVPEWETKTVALRSLDSIVQELDLPQIMLAKMDIEGHEHHALRGFERTLRAGRLSYLLSEVSGYWLERQGSSEAAFLAYTRELGLQPHPLGRALSDSVLLSANSRETR